MYILTFYFIGYLEENDARLKDANTGLRDASQTLLNGINFYGENQGTVNINDNCIKIKSILENSFNSPANLRYGVQDKLGDLVDPMGDSHGIMSDMDVIWFSYEEYMHDVHKIGDYYYLESSTGLHITGGPQVSWFIRCQENNERCGHL